MARKIDPAVESILKGLKLDPKEVLWDCHGTWCMYHRAIERVAVEQKITFSPPAILQNDAEHKSVAICVTGKQGERTEWSIGEAAPGNNKNAYPWAMAEKRAKDRVVLKLIGLHGLIYSEDEMDAKAPPPPPVPEDAAFFKAQIAAIFRDGMGDFWALQEWGMDAKEHKTLDGLLPPEKEDVLKYYVECHGKLKAKKAEKEED